ncbi:MAG: transcription antitermination factor NusB [Gallicola sp.]|mgnify:CR=1 FL=1|nr:transcription antitermination factor NusB [Gallicola sp.]
MSRKNARTWAMKLFYSMDMNQDYTKEYFRDFLNQHSLPKDEKDYIRSIYYYYYDHQEYLNNIIRSHLSKWKLERIAKIDISIIRIAMIEILYIDNVPDSVAINEAVEIAKLYAAEDAYKFINGVLGSVVRDKEGLDG